MSTNAHNITILPTMVIEGKQKQKHYCQDSFSTFYLVCNHHTINKLRLHNNATLNYFIQWNVHQYNHYHLFLDINSRKKLCSIPNTTERKIQCLAKEFIPELFLPLDPMANVSSKIVVGSRDLMRYPNIILMYAILLFMTYINTYLNSI